MLTKTRVTLTIDTELYENMKSIMRNAGLKLSTFTETMYRTVVDSETKPMKDVYETAFTELLKGSKKLNPKPKK